jgi:large-conductance mechanosensitive channel
MLKEFKEFMLRRDLNTVAAGLVMAFATFYLLEAIVSGLIAPLISIFIGDSPFEPEFSGSVAANSDMAS